MSKFRCFSKAITFLNNLGKLSNDECKKIWKDIDCDYHGKHHLYKKYTLYDCDIIQLWSRLDNTCKTEFCDWCVNKWMIERNIIDTAHSVPYSEILKELQLTKEIETSFKAHCLLVFNTSKSNHDQTPALYKYYTKIGPKFSSWDQVQTKYQNQFRSWCVALLRSILRGQMKWVLNGITKVSLELTPERCEEIWPLLHPICFVDDKSSIYYKYESRCKRNAIRFWVSLRVDEKEGLYDWLEND